MSGAADAALGFDVKRLEAWMAANVAGFQGPLSLKRFSGGQSNPTFAVETPGAKYVLRRKPMGQLLKGAHAVDREARVMTALGGVGFPVPKVHALCVDDSVIGSWFFVMDLVEGRIFWDSTFPGVADDARAAHFDAMNQTIAALHSIDPAAVGLADFGRSDNYLGRQIGRWSKQYLEDVDAGRNADMDMLIEWLPAHIPPGDETSVVHGDFRVDNMIYHPTEPRVLAVLDWELSTLGHPLADFAYHLMMYRVPPAMPGGLLGRDLAALGLPGEAQYARRYCERTGRDGIAHLDVYLAYNLFRMAAIIHGIKGRAARGTAANANAAEMINNLDFMARAGRELAETIDKG